MHLYLSYALQLACTMWTVEFHTKKREQDRKFLNLQRSFQATKRKSIEKVILSFLICWENNYFVDEVIPCFQHSCLETQHIFCVIVNRCLCPQPTHLPTHVHIHANTPARVCFSISWTAVTAETSAWQSAVFSVQKQAAGLYCWERSPSRCWCWWVAGKVKPSAAGLMAYQKEETNKKNKSSVRIRKYFEVSNFLSVHGVKVLDLSGQHSIQVLLSCTHNCFFILCLTWQWG